MKSRIVRGRKRAPRGVMSRGVMSREVMSREVTPRKLRLLPALVGIVLLGGAACASGQEEGIELPGPSHGGDVSLEEALYRREGVRSFSDRPLELRELAQLLWSGDGKSIDGVSGPTRTAPSAGGIYPARIHAVVGAVDGLEPGVYTYDWRTHSLHKRVDGDLREEVARASLNQRFVAEAPAVIVISADCTRSRQKYGERGMGRYCYMDAAHAAQNIFLQAEALQLGTVTVGAFRDRELLRILEVSEAPLYVMPVGYPQ